MVFLFDDVVKMVQSSISAGMNLLTLANGSGIQIKENYDNLKQGRQETTQRITESTDEFNNTNNLQELQKIQQQLNELLEQKKIRDTQNYYKDENNVPIDKDKQEISTITFEEYQKQQELKERQQPQNLLKSTYQSELPVKNTILPVPDTDNTWVKNNEILVNNSINNNKNVIQRGGVTRKKSRKSYKKYKKGNFSKKNARNS
jgi:glucosamine 6-phosphate synthetase-like amidotransferase/phosphosugar isomerase protein